MSHWRYNLQTRKTIGLVLIFAIFLQFIVQLQVHIHHENHADVVTHNDHVIDYHMVTEINSHEPSSSDEVHELKTSPDIILKKSLDQYFTLLVSVLFLIAASIIQTRSKPIWEFLKNKFIHNFYYSLAPPSRAPPVI